ncbi:MAG: polymer-forming cytoskeletal protein [Acidobacteria bacterium]|nr:polymer-forming cytoskeletal protein [Acidobacteriota bacterium]
MEIADGATVEGEIVTERLVITDGAVFQGVVDPSRADAAFAVFRHERSRRG